MAGDPTQKQTDSWEWNARRFWLLSYDLEKSVKIGIIAITGLANRRIQNRMLGWGDLYAHVGLSIYYLQCYLTLHGPSNRLLEAAIGSPFTSVGHPVKKPHPAVVASCSIPQHFFLAKSQLQTLAGLGFSVPPSLLKNFPQVSQNMGAMI